MTTTKTQYFDLAIIGGGINGVGIARDAAGRGLKVFLCEQNDLASGTSSHSSQLIHGGLRYLQYGDLRLVKESLTEQKNLLHIAPHLVTPLQFILPHQPSMRPAWLIRSGLFIYDHLAHRQHLPHASMFSLDKNNLSLHHCSKAFSYYDCLTDDARLVIANAQSARELSATIRTQTECVALKSLPSQAWQLNLFDKIQQQHYQITAKTLVNATGPWVNEVNARLNISAAQAKLVKGSHIVVRKFYEGDHAYTLQHDDGRIVFVIPYQSDYCLIGTTDISCESITTDNATTMTEISYLCDLVNHYFQLSISKQDIVHTYWGIRALQSDNNDNPSAISREYKLELNTLNNAAMISIIGGKLTTYRRLAEQVLQLLAPYLSCSTSSWTATRKLPGGTIKTDNFVKYHQELQEKYNWLPAILLTRYIKQYGCDCEVFLAHCRQLSDLGLHIAHGLFEAEINYLIAHEWARTAEDILWRRTKLGLCFSQNEKTLLTAFIHAKNLK